MTGSWLRFAGRSAALEIPYELLVKNFNASYSASRGALLEAWKMFRMYRTWLANDFCQPIYEEWFAEAVAKGRIPRLDFGDPYHSQGVHRRRMERPGAGAFEPGTGSDCGGKRVQNGFSTRDREAMEVNGSDFYRNAAQIKREEKMLRRRKQMAQEQSRAQAQHKQVKNKHFWTFRAAAGDNAAPELILYGDIASKRGGATK